jgi:hypothetical protein
MVTAEAIIADATDGALPNFSVVTPTAANSQHNEDLMDNGDNWLGRVIAAIQDGPQWANTAVFITYDDCGCFYDHVSPPKGLGIRVPMVIVSPYAKPGFTDSNVASFSRCSPSPSSVRPLAANRPRRRRLRVFRRVRLRSSAHGRDETGTAPTGSGGAAVRQKASRESHRLFHLTLRAPQSP